MEKVDRIIQMEIGRINSHLPKARKSLCELLKEDSPSIELRDGSLHYFRRSELEFLKTLAGEEACLVKLPIILELSTLDRGYFVVRGRGEVRVIKKLLELSEDIYLEENTVRLPRYYLPTIRRKLPTTTVYAFITEW